MSDYTCAWCSKQGYNSGKYNPEPEGWVWSKGSLFKKKLVCSNKCLAAFNEQNTASEAVQSKSSNSDDEEQIRQSTPEEEIAKTNLMAIKAQEETKQMQLSIERRRENEQLKKEKILNYRSQGKKFLAFTG